VKQGILEQLVLPGRVMDGDNTNSARFQGDDSGKSLFSFLAMNTDVEWSLTQYNKNSDFIATSHEKGREWRGPTEALDLATAGNLIREFDHDHPSTTLVGPSGCFMNDRITLDASSKGQLGGDIFFANKLIDINNVNHPNNTILFQVFDRSSQQIIKFDNQNVLNYAPWP